MKPVLITIALLTIFTVARAEKQDTVKTTNTDTTIVDNPAKSPEFSGGLPKLYRYLSKIVRYPAKAKEYNIQGKVVLTFVVEKDGSISNIKVKNSVSPELDNETVRVIKLAPKFIPGKNQNGEPVRCYFDFPFTYTLQIAD